MLFEIGCQACLKVPCVEATFHAEKTDQERAPLPAKIRSTRRFSKYGDPPGHTTPNGDERGEHFSPAWAAGEPPARLGAAARLCDG